MDGALRFGSQQQWILRNADLAPDLKALSLHRHTGWGAPVIHAAGGQTTDADAAAADATAAAAWLAQAEAAQREAAAGRDTLNGAWSLVFVGVDGLADSVLNSSSAKISIEAAAADAAAAEAPAAEATDAHAADPLIRDHGVANGPVLYSVVPKAPVVAEKPFISIDPSTGKPLNSFFFLQTWCICSPCD